MKFVIAGAGAVGGYMARADGARRAGRHAARARPHLGAMRSAACALWAGRRFRGRPAVAGDPAAIGPADVVFLAVKAHSLPALAPHLAPLLGPDTAWSACRTASRGGSPPNLETRGSRRRASPPPSTAGRVVGCIVYFATEMVEPGVIRHVEGNRISIGEPEGGRSERCREIAAALTAAGLRCPVTARIRQEIWVKLLGNVAFNPISALTGATLAAMAARPGRARAGGGDDAGGRGAGRGLGIELPISIEQRMAGAEKVGEHKTSMLQDLEAGRRLELEAMVGAVLELAARHGVAMPHTRAVYACTKLRATAG